MTRCTEPERWTTVPGADAAEEEVVRYLAHVDVCPYHAAVEQREEALMRGIGALARRDLSAPGAAAEVQAGAAVSSDRPNAQVESRRARSQPDAATDRVGPGPRPPAGPARASRRLPARRLAVALCALAAVALPALVLFLPKERPAPVARQEQPARTDETPAPPTPTPPTPEATPFNTQTQNPQDVAPGPAPAPPRLSRDGGRVSPTPRTRERLTVADVRRIYVGAGEGTYDRQLREALIERLRAGDRFVVVTGERQADAVLLREQTRGAGVSMHLITRGGTTLWFTTQPAGAGGVEDVGDLAERIVAALNAAADRRPTPTDAPRR